MIFTMFNIIRKQFQIINAIIGMDTIYMMDNFFRSQIASEVFFHYKAMFKNIISYTMKRMVRREYFNISTIYFSIASPSWIITTRHVSMIFDHPITSNSRSLFSILTIVNAYIIFERALPTAILSILSGIGDKLLTTKFTFYSYSTMLCYTTAFFRTVFCYTMRCYNFLTAYLAFFNHIITSIKKALFGGLQRTIKFSHLLRAIIVDTKNSFSVSNITIPQGI